MTSRRQNTYGSTDACGISFGASSHRRRRTVAVAALVELVVEDAHDRRGEDVDLERLRRAGSRLPPSNVRAGVQPADVADQALLAEGQLLPADATATGACGGADVGKRHAQVERRRGTALPVGPTVFFGDARVLHLHLERQASSRRDRRVQAERG